MLLGADVAFVFLSLFLAVLLRYDFSVGPRAWSLYYWAMIPYILLSRIPLAILFGLYRWSFRYASVIDLLKIFYSVSTGAVLRWYFLSAAGQPFSRSILIIEAGIAFLFMSGMRFGGRVSQTYLKATSAAARSAIIVGDPAQVDVWVRSLAGSGKIPYVLRAAVCPRSSLIGQSIHNLPVLSVDMVGAFAREHGIKDALVISDAISGPDLRKIIEQTSSLGIRFQRILTSRRALLEQGKASRLFDEIRPEDLLRRNRVRTDLAPVREKLSGKRVWVTGAAGSIGSELVRQLLEVQPEELTLVDFNENGLYLIAREIEQRQAREPRLKSVKLRERFLDLKQHARVADALNEDRPEFVFHAAAHKHVMMMENHPHSAIENNVLALRQLLLSASRAGVTRFINISTDKASDPVSVMGATKRLGELMCALGDYGQMETVSVRFGNVLGSQGSVIPLFLAQIDRGGPVTITDKRVTRYFMTIAEAVELILQATSFGKGPNIYLLDMGSSVKMYDLAKELITLRGFIPEVEIPIVEIGLRDGEKMHEQLHNDHETLLPTVSEAVLELRSALPERERFFEDLEALFAKGPKLSTEQLRSQIIDWVGAPEKRRLEMAIARERTMPPKGEGDTLAQRPLLKPPSDPPIAPTGLSTPVGENVDVDPHVVVGAE